MSTTTVCAECGAEDGHKLGCAADPAQILGLPPDDAAVRAFEATHDEVIEAIVDGREAILDGRTGGVAQPMIVADETDDSVLAHLAACVEKEARLRTAANRAKNALSKAHKETEAAQQHAAEYYSRTRQLDLELTTGGTEPEDDE